MRSRISHGRLQLDDVAKLYVVGDTEVRALDGVSVDVGEGEFVVIPGPSGSGKWTLPNLVGTLDTATYQLSGGEQQRVAIARALASENPILLADEPTGELDFRTGVEILGVLEEQARAGMTILVVTHNREISRIADRVIELSSGRIASDGPPAGGRADIADLQW